MKKTLLLLSLCTTCLLLQGCDPLAHPTGVWICEELSMTVDFDDKGDDFLSGKGEMIVDGLSIEIACMLEQGGLRVKIVYLDEEGKYIRPDDYNHDGEELFIKGFFQKEGKNKMTLYETVPTKEGAKRTGVEYTFVREDASTKTGLGESLDANPADGPVFLVLGILGASSVRSGQT